MSQPEALCKAPLSVVLEGIVEMSLDLGLDGSRKSH